jgi:hypothetical protein
VLGQDINTPYRGKYLVIFKRSYSTHSPLSSLSYFQDFTANLEVDRISKITLKNELKDFYILLRQVRNLPIICIVVGFLAFVFCSLVFIIFNIYVDILAVILNYDIFSGNLNYI